MGVHHESTHSSGDGGTGEHKMIEGIILVACALAILAIKVKNSDVPAEYEF